MCHPRHRYCTPVHPCCAFLSPKMLLAFCCDEQEMRCSRYSSIACCCALSATVVIACCCALSAVNLLHDRVQPFCGSQESALHIPLAIFYVVQGKVTDRGCSSCAPLCYNSGCHHMSRTVLSVTDIKQNIHSSGYTLSIHLSGYTLNKAFIYQTSQGHLACGSGSSGGGLLRTDVACGTLRPWRTLSAAL